MIKESHFENILTSAISILSQSEFHNQNFTQPLIKKSKKNITCIQCTFTQCKNRIGQKGGAFQAVQCPTFLLYCVFVDNFATYSGSVEIQDSPRGIVNFTLIRKSEAERFGAMMLDGHEATDTGHIFYSNFTENKAEKWIGGVRLQHNGGIISFSIFQRNYGHSYGALWDYCYKPAFRRLENLYFLNNTSHEIGAGFTSFHLLFSGKAQNCFFFFNRNLNGFNGRSILVHSYASLMDVNGCFFEGKVDEEVTTYFKESTIRFDESNSFNSKNLTKKIVYNV